MLCSKHVRRGRGEDFLKNEVRTINNYTDVTSFVGVVIQWVKFVDLCFDIIIN